MEVIDFHHKNGHFVKIDEVIHSFFKKMEHQTTEPKLVKIVCHYDDGSSEEIDGVSLQNYLDNMRHDAIMNLVHGNRSYKEVTWKKNPPVKPS